MTKNPAVSSLLKVVSYGLKAQSIYSVNQNTADMLNELSENLEGVYDALSTDIETSTKVLSEQLLSQTGYIVDTLKRENYAKSISEFFSSDFGTDVYGQKVGYYSWKKSLFNDYSRLVYFTNAESADEKDLRQVYDDLYVNARRLSVLSAAMTGTKSITDIPIQQTLYNYYLLRANTSQDVDMTSAVNSCIDFVRDMYETYLFAQTCLSVCYRYQIDWLDEKYDGVYDTKSYPLYDERDRTVSYYSEIKPYIAAPEAGLETINAELASYFSYILQLCEYYQYNYEGELRKVVYNTFSSAQTSGSVPVQKENGTVPNCYLTVNDSCAKGETLYLNGLPKELTSLFGGKFAFESSDPTLATVSDEGVVNVIGDGGKFTLSLKYNQKVVYEMAFKIDNGLASPFSGGGKGTERNPYRLKTVADLKKLAGDSSLWGSGIYFELGGNIDAAGVAIGQIGTSPSAEFYGNFDGKGFMISNLNADSKSLFGFNSGRIENLMIRGAKVTSGYQDCLYLYAGALVSQNSGEVVNCRVSECTVDVRNLCSSANYANEWMFVGGICGWNGGRIERCAVEKSTVKGYSKNGCYEGGGACEQNGGDAGGIVGKSGGGVISDCLSADNTVYLEIHSWSYYLCIWYLGQKKYYQCTAYFRAGGLGGEINDTAVSGCVVYGNSVSRKWGSGRYEASGNTEHWGGTHYENPSIESFVGLGSGSSYNRNYCDAPQTDRAGLISGASAADQAAFAERGWEWGNRPALKMKTSIRVLREPDRISYARGESLNIGGLVLEANDGTLIVDGYTVSGFDSSVYGKKTVTVNWNNLTATFECYIVCPHTHIEVSEQKISDVCTKRITESTGVCEECGNTVYTVQYDESGKTHTYNNPCTDRVCTICGEARTNVPGHNYDEGTVSVAPTCGGEGMMMFRCRECGDVKFMPISATGAHTAGDWIIDEEATCTKTGSMHKECTVCHAVIARADIKLLNHDLTHHEGREASCTQKGWKAYDECANCDYTTYEEIAAKGHKAGAAATCTTAQVCTECGEELKAALGHDYSERWVTDEEATCTEAGYKSHHCNRCDSIKDVTEIAAKGHKTGAAATCTAAQVCTECGEELKAAVGHAESDWIVDKEAEVGVAGHRHKECAVCGETYAEEEIEALYKTAKGCKAVIGQSSAAAIFGLAVLAWICRVAKRKE